MEDKTIGQRIAAKRRELGLSQIDLGEQMGVSRQSVSKWEADGAIPEIDKLIALSKLFDVSVGWLLGVEEAQPQQTEPEQTFSPKEWEIIDRLTQNQPRLPRWLVPLSAAAAAVALIAVILAGAAVSHVRAQQEKLDVINRAIALLPAGMQDGLSDPAVLENDRFVLRPSGDLQSCTLEFTGTPPAYTAGDVGELLIFADGQPVATTPCQWNGTAYTGSVTLDVRNGYSTIFTVTSQKGTMRSTTVYDHAVYRMADAAGFGPVGVEFADHEYVGGTLTLTDMDFTIDLPDLLRDCGDIWSRCDLVVLGDGQELGRLDILNRSKYSRQTNFSGNYVTFFTRSQAIDIGSIDNYETIELVLDCGFTTDVEMLHSIHTWTVRDGAI